jgi:DNA topoisomerase-1
MSKHLVIVESPAKAKKIQPYLGSDFEAVASLGHVRDLPKKGMSIDIEHGFTPTYEINPDKKKTIAELKRKAKGNDVWLASDPDREGEAIAWHLCEALGLKPENTKRIVFHEVTKPAILAAIQAPRHVDKNLVDAQQARRVLDRLVGYELSPVLWKKVRPGLSAGRVQSVAVRLIVEREREVTGHEAAVNFKVTAIFDVEGSPLKTELTTRLKTEAEVQALLERLKGASFAVENLEAKPGKRTPAPPFTTSTLQQEASRKLGFSVRQTMSVAQRLYEAGFISYMRTDSVNLSETALAGAAAAITKEYGKEYAQRRSYVTKTAGAQEAHEAIRPTDFGAPSVSAEPAQQRLYQLIWQRAIASQMTDAKLERTIVTVAPAGQPERFTAQAETIQFDGFLKVYIEGRDEEDESEANLLPPLKVGQGLGLTEMLARQSFTRPKPRYTEASLVRKLEEMGIGRPSTYAPTISTIQDREYVIKGDLEGTEREVIALRLAGDDISRVVETEVTGADRNKLLPTPIGELVTDFLVKYFPNIVDYDFTAEAEAEFDQVAAGKQTWNKLIADFYGPFHKSVEAAELVSRQEVSQARLIGNDPKSGKPIYARLGRYGPMLQMGEASDEEKPTFAPIPEGTRMDSITLEQTLTLFELPRTVGQTSEGEDILANFGPFGPYIKAGTTNASIKPDDPFSITLERARELIKEKREVAANRVIAEFGGGVSVLNGRFGPYITDGKKNAKIPKGTEPKSIDEKQAKELLAAAPTRGAKRRRPARRAS